MKKEYFFNRKLTSPINFTDEKVSDDEIRDMLDVARWAPSHKLTQPWRFIVLRDEAMNRMEQFMEKAYTEGENPLSALKLEKKLVKVKKSQAIILIVMHRDPAERVPEWEEIAATACAVENMWVYACNNGMGGYWSSPGFIKDINQLVDLQENERCLGLFYLGKVSSEMPDMRKRMEVDEISRWLYK